MDRPCTLKCLHGGTCALGKSLHGFETEELGDELGSLFSKHNFLMNCVCPPGFTGLYCEIKLVECPSTEKCFNGKECAVSEDDYGHPFSHCECDGIISDLSQPYAVHFCGETSTAYCHNGGSGQMSFCKNGGRCLTDIQNHPGCECTPDWEGPHCEFIKGTFYMQPIEKSDKVAFALYGFAIALLIIAVVMVVAFAQRRRMTKSKLNVVKEEGKDGLFRSVLEDYERNQDDDEESDGSDEEYESRSGDESESSGDEYESDEELQVEQSKSPLYGDPTSPAVL